MAPTSPPFGVHALHDPLPLSAEGPVNMAEWPRHNQGMLHGVVCNEDTPAGFNKQLLCCERALHPDSGCKPNRPAREFSPTTTGTDFCQQPAGTCRRTQAPAEDTTQQLLISAL